MTPEGGTCYDVINVTSEQFAVPFVLDECGTVTNEPVVAFLITILGGWVAGCNLFYEQPVTCVQLIRFLSIVLSSSFAAVSKLFSVRYHDCMVVVHYHLLTTRCNAVVVSAVEIVYWYFNNR